MADKLLDRGEERPAGGATTYPVVSLGILWPTDRDEDT